MLLSEEAKKLDQELDEAIKAVGPNLNKELKNIMDGGEVSFVAKTYADYERERSES